MVAADEAIPSYPGADRQPLYVCQHLLSSFQPSSHLRRLPRPLLLAMQGQVPSESPGFMFTGPSLHLSYRTPHVQASGSHPGGKENSSLRHLWVDCMHPRCSMMMHAHKCVAGPQPVCEVLHADVVDTQKQRVSALQDWCASAQMRWWTTLRTGLKGNSHTILSH